MKNRHFSDQLAHLSKLSDEMSFETTTARLYATGSIAKPVRSRIDMMTTVHLAGTQGTVSELPKAVY